MLTRSKLIDETLDHGWCELVKPDRSKRRLDVVSDHLLVAVHRPRLNSAQVFRLSQIEPLGNGDFLLGQICPVIHCRRQLR